MAKLTKEQKDKYISKGSVHCPHCGSDNIEGHSIEIDENGAYQIVVCGNCEKSWTDVYTLTGITEEKE